MDGLYYNEKPQKHENTPTVKKVSPWHICYDSKPEKDGNYICQLTNGIVCVCGYHNYMVQGIWSVPRAIELKSGGKCDVFAWADNPEPMNSEEIKKEFEQSNFRYSDSRNELPEYIGGNYI